ncbi:LOW QUALITY PROTEIN: hypothetical protein MXB_2046, partial [Myxobolus squamalis]
MIVCSRTLMANNELRISSDQLFLSEQDDINIEKILNKKTIEQLIDFECDLKHESQMKSLVYENYNKLLQTSEIIQNMTNEFVETQKNLSSVETCLINGFEDSDSLMTLLKPSQQNLNKIQSNKSNYSLLQLIFGLPQTIQKNLDSGNYIELSQYPCALFNDTKNIIAELSVHSSVAAIRKEIDIIISKAKECSYHRIRTLFFKKLYDIRQIDQLIDSLILLGDSYDSVDNILEQMSYMFLNPFRIIEKIELHAHIPLESRFSTDNITCYTLDLKTFEINLDLCGKVFILLNQLNSLVYNQLASTIIITCQHRYYIQSINESLITSLKKIVQTMMMLFLSLNDPNKTENKSFYQIFDHMFIISVYSDYLYEYFRTLCCKLCSLLCQSDIYHDPEIILNISLVLEEIGENMISNLFSQFHYNEVQTSKNYCTELINLFHENSEIFMTNYIQRFTDIHLVSIIFKIMQLIEESSLYILDNISQFSIKINRIIHILSIFKQLNFVFSPQNNIKFLFVSSSEIFEYGLFERDLNKLEIYDDIINCTTNAIITAMYKIIAKSLRNNISIIEVEFFNAGIYSIEQIIEIQKILYLIKKLFSSYENMN